MTLVREVGWLCGHDITLGSLKDYLGNLEEVTMDIIFLIYLSKSFDSLFGRRISYHLHVNVLSENDSILGSL